MTVIPSAAELADVRPLTRAFRALGDPTRLRIVALLTHGELCVCHLEAALGISQPNCSRHLAILKAAELVDSRRDGSWVYYRVSAPAHAAVQAVVAVLATTFAAERALRADHARLRKRCGPSACP